MRICRLTLTTWAFNGFLCSNLGQKLEAARLQAATAAPLISTWQKLRQVERILQRPQRAYPVQAGQTPLPLLLSLSFSLRSLSVEWKVFLRLRRPFRRRAPWATSVCSAHLRCSRGSSSAPDSTASWTFALHLDTRNSPVGRVSWRRVLLKYLSCSNAQKVRNAIAIADAMGKVCLIARSQHISMLWPRFLMLSLSSSRNCFPRPVLTWPGQEHGTRNWRTF